MQYTGERITDEGGSNAEAKEYYTLARQYVKGMTLDAACGIGWGSDYLAPLSSYYFGADISDEAIAHAVVLN